MEIAANWELVLTWFGHVNVIDWGLTWDDCQAMLKEVVYINDGLGVYHCEVEV